MKLSGRVKWILAVAILCAAIPVTIFISLNAKNLFYNHYRELYIRGDYSFPSIFKKDSCNNLKLEHLSINHLGDTMCLCTYNQNRGMMLWQAKEFNSVPLSKITLIDSSVEVKDHFTFLKIQSIDKRFPLLTLVMEPTLTPALSLTVCVKDFKIDTVIRTDNYIYYCLNFSSMEFYRNNRFNFMISKFPSQSCNFIIYKYKGVFFMMYFYSLDYDPKHGVAPIKKDELLKILNL